MNNGCLIVNRNLILKLNNPLEKYTKACLVIIIVFNWLLIVNKPLNQSNSGIIYFDFTLYFNVVNIEQP